MSATALVLQHGPTGPPGLLGEWLTARGIPAEVHETYSGAEPPQLEGRLFVASLGSRLSPRTPEEPAVAAELARIDDAVRLGVPVLGLCYGGQVLASVLGGSVEEAPEPELGWQEIATRDAAQIPPGPWLEWHYDRFTMPAGAQELATTPAATQAFRSGPHLGLQFHPESTIEIASAWAATDGVRLAAAGRPDAGEIMAAARHHAAGAARSAFQLFDAFWSAIKP
jgi:GMP synthase-like glutamine amidotransferase